MEATPASSQVQIGPLTHAPHPVSVLRKKKKILKENPLPPGSPSDILTSLALSFVDTHVHVVAGALGVVCHVKIIQWH